MYKIETMNYWLMKSEPDVFSIEHLKMAPNSTAPWDGVRNYQARNYIKEMRVGDLILFYHSSCKEVGVAGIAKIAREAYPDHTSWDPKSKYYDEKSTQHNPRWFMVDVKWEKSFKHIISLSQLKQCKQLEQMKLLQKGSRLSVMPVTQEEFEFITTLSIN